MIMAEGPSKFLTPKLTNHAKTNIWLAEQFVGKKFKVTPIKNLVEISC